MSFDLIRAQNARHQALKDFAIGYKLAEVTDLDPLTVSPSGGGEVPAVCLEGTELDVGDAAITVDLGPGYPPLVLGRVGGRSQVSFTSVTGDGTAVKNETISHNLGVAPRLVVAIANNGDYNVATGSYTSTNFVAIVRNVDAAAWSSTQTVRWIAYS